jgi:hypothetical protein
MGILICMTALPAIDVNVVKHEIQVIASKKAGYFKPVPTSKSPEKNLIFGRNDNGSVTIIYPKGFDGCDESSQRLSAVLKASVFSFKLDNNDSWWAYKLYANGTEVDRFSPWQQYFAEEEGDKSGKRYPGNPTVVISNWRAGTIDGIEKYYGYKSTKDCTRKAYSTDHFTQCDEWLLVDFMKKLGLKYPVDSKGRVHGEEYTFRWVTR